MFKTKSEVDKYVSRMQQHSRKNSDGLKIAKLYFDLKEYETARNYLASYLSENTHDALGWKLMGEICEIGDKNWLKAIDYYMKYYELDPQASPILLKICNCFKNLDKNYEKAMPWLEKAEKIYPYSKQVIELKEKIWNYSDKTDVKLIDWEDYLKNAIKENSFDEDLHLKLIQCFIANRKFNDLIEFILDLEIKRLFTSSLTWYDAVCEYLENLISSDNLTVKLVYIILLSQKLNIYIEYNDVLLIKKLLIKVDKTIKEYDTFSIEINELNNFKEILSEIKSSFIYQFGLFITKLNKKSIKVIDDYELLCNTCFILSSLNSKPNTIKKQMKIKENSKISQLLVDYIHYNSCWRYSAIGHWLKRASDNDQIIFIDRIKQYCENNNIKEILMSLIYFDLDKNAQNYLNESYLNGCKEFKIPTDEYLFVDLITLSYADKICLNNQNSNLKYLVWYALIQNYKNPLEFPQFYVPIINTISYGVENLHFAIWESISFLDLEIFLYATYLQCFSLKTSPNQIEPYLIETNLCTNEQYDWWLKYTYSKQKSQQAKKFKLNAKNETQLNHTIEILRLNKNSSKQMDFQMCIRVGLYLQNKYKQEKYQQAQQQLSIIDEKLLADQLNYFEYLSPYEKSNFIFIYLLHYWSYIANYVNISRRTTDDNFYSSDASFTSSISSSCISTASNGATKKMKLFFSLLSDGSLLSLFSFDFDESQLPFSKYVYENSLVYLAFKKYEEYNFKASNDVLNMIAFDEPLLLDQSEVFEELAEKILKNREVNDADYDQLVETLKIKLDLLDEYKKMKESKIRRAYSTNLLDTKKSSINNSKQQLFEQSFNESITSSIIQYTDQNDTQNLFKQTNTGGDSGVASSSGTDTGKNKIYQSSPIKNEEATQTETKPITVETTVAPVEVAAQEQFKTPTKTVSLQENMCDEIQFDNGVHISKSDNFINIQTQSPVKISIETTASPTSVSETGSALSSGSASGSGGALNVTFQLLQQFNQQRLQTEQSPFKLHLMKDILRNQFNVLSLQYSAINAEILELHSTINSIKSRRAN